MLRETVLFQTGLAAFSRFEHPEAERHEDPREETASRFAISFLERGRYTIRRGGATTEFTPESVFLQRPGLEYSCRHSLAIPDDVSLSLEFSPDHVPAAIDAASERVHLAPTNRLAYARLRLMAASARNFDAISFEARALEAVEAAAEAARPRARDGSPGRSSPVTPAGSTGPANGWSVATTRRTRSSRSPGSRA